jgi:hypothetical protein
MIGFERIKEDHFQNLPFTKKQITDVYNSINGTSKNEENLVFVETKAIFLDATLPDPPYFVGNGEFGFCHYIFGGHNSRATIGLSGLIPIQVNLRSSDQYSDQMKNFFFTAILQAQGECFYCFSVFKFA